jgi:hypothetical protein
VTRVVVFGLVAGLVSAAAPGRVAAQPAPAAIHRVFLIDGHALPSYGEAAEVGQRVVFSLWLGSTSDGPSLALVSLPVAVVDLERTRGYALAMRAAHYAATRGETDYAAMTVEVERSIARLHQIADPAERLRLAREARVRLRAWSAAHYRYRASDIDRLVALFDDVIAALVADGAAVEPGDVELSFDEPNLTAEALIAAPSASEAWHLALIAAVAADLPAERRAILAALEPVVEAGGATDLLDGVRRRLAEERRVDVVYATLVSRVIAEADRAAASGDLNRIGTLREWLIAENAEMGDRRPADVAMLSAYLDERAAAAAARRDALTRYRSVRPLLLTYERQVRPVTSRLDGLRPTLERLSEGEASPYATLETAERRLSRLADDLHQVTPPPDAADIHATFVSAVHLAGAACARARVGLATAKPDPLRDASAAAAGAILLLDAARATLVDRLYPPRGPS